MSAGTKGRVSFQRWPSDHLSFRLKFFVLKLVLYYALLAASQLPREGSDPTR